MTQAPEAPRNWRAVARCGYIQAVGAAARKRRRAARCPAQHPQVRDRLARDRQIRGAHSQGRTGPPPDRTPIAVEPSMDKRTLKEIRKARRRTQVELAAKLEINQSNVARAEQAHDARISDLAAYIEALGGQLDLVARFPGEAPVLIEGLSNDKPLKR